MSNVNKTYQKLSLKDHIKKIPDTYVGDIDLQNETLYTLSKSDKIKIEKKEIVYAPGLFKIYDEIIVNSLDHISRLLYIKDKKDVEHYVSKIRITIENNQICVFNDGDGIDLVKMNDGKYPPQLIFGELLSSTNYNEKDIKTIGGKNGYGSKLVNIFSKYFLLSYSAIEIIFYLQIEIFIRKIIFRRNELILPQKLILKAENAPLLIAAETVLKTTKNLLKECFFG